MIGVKGWWGSSAHDGRVVMVQGWWSGWVVGTQAWWMLGA